MEKTHYSEGKFFWKRTTLPIPGQWILSAPPTTPTLPLPLKRLENFSNPFHFPVVLEMKYCSEMDYTIKRVTSAWSSFLDFKFSSFLSNHFMKELFLL